MPLLLDIHMSLIWLMRSGCLASRYTRILSAHLVHKELTIVLLIRGTGYTEFDFRLQSWCVFLEFLYQHLSRHTTGRLTNCVRQLLTMRGMPNQGLSVMRQMAAIGIHSDTIPSPASFALDPCAIARLRIHMNVSPVQI